MSTNAAISSVEQAVTTIEVSHQGAMEVLSSGTTMPQDWFFEAMTGHPRDGGVVVNSRTILGHGPVWAGVNVLASDLSRLPFEVRLEVTASGRTTTTRRKDHWVDQLLNLEVNHYQTVQQWKECMAAWAIVWGNGISEIVNLPGGGFGLYPLRPDVTWAEQVGRYDWVIMTLDDESGPRPILPENTFHVRGLSDDGFWGLSLAQVCKSTFKAGMAALAHGNATYDNDGIPGGVIQLERQSTREQRREMREEWRENHATKRAGTVGVLPLGAKWQDIAMSLRDAQYIDSLNLDVEQVARLLQIPPFKIGHMKDSSVRANLGAQQREYVEHSLTKHGVRFEEEANRKLLTRRERRPTGRQLSVVVNYDKLVTGTKSERADYASKLVTSRLWTPNEGREEVGSNPSDDPAADEFQNPAIDTSTSVGESNAESESTDNTEAMEALLRSQVTALLKHERARLQTNGRKAKDFVGWCRRFYTEQYLDIAKGFLDPACAVAAVDWTAAAQMHATLVLSAIKSGRDRDFDWITERVDAYLSDIQKGA